MNEVTVAVLAGVGAVAVGVAARSWLMDRQARAASEARAAEAEGLLASTRAAEADDRRVRDVVLSTMRDGILLVRPDGVIAFANRSVGDHLGTVPGALETLLPLALRKGILEAQRQGAPRAVLVETGAPSRWLRATITPAVGDHLLVVVQDVTEQHRLDAVRRDFVENASHELKTPAATIQATAETLRQAAEDDPDAVPRFAVRLEREAVRLSRLVADLLDLSRIESGTPLDEMVSLSALAREECQRLQSAADAAGVALELRTETEQPIPGSSKDLSLLIRNLVDNAIRYSREGDKVIVEIEPAPGGIVLRVRDTGIGIPSRDLSRIFERFYRVDRARSRETGGTGLGLAIVKHVVENHRGDARVESELGRGTTFEVVLPGDSDDPSMPARRR
jgi:two-component system sensor histidine kinase SenX3